MTTPNLQPEQHTGVMLAFFLNPIQAEGLAFRPERAEGFSAEPAGDLHITLAYLGEVPDLVAAGVDPEQFAEKCAEFARSMPYVEGKLNGLARFGGDEGQGDSPFVALYDAPSLPDWRHKLTEFLKECGISHVQNHGYIPHVTLAYVPQENPNPACAMPSLPLVFDRLTLAWGDDRKEFTLKQPEEDQQAKPEPTAEDKKLAVAIARRVVAALAPKGSKAYQLMKLERDMAKQQQAGRKSSTAIASARTDQRAEFKAVSNGEVLRDGIPGIYVAGWASVKKPIDRYGDTIDRDAFNNDSYVTYFELNPILLYEHGQDPIVGNKPLGEVVEWKDDEYGLWIKAWIPRPVWEPMLEIYNKIVQGILKTFSIGGLWSRQGSEIISADLMEISVVATPAQAYAVFDLAKRFAGAETKSLTIGQKRQMIAQTIALASLEYRTSEGKRLLKLKNISRERKLLAVARIIRASRQLEKITHSTN